MYWQCTRVWLRAAYVVAVPVVMARHGGMERRGGRRRLVVDSCATRWREKLVGAAQGTAAMRVVRPLSGRATTGERAWKRERVSAPPCMWDLGRFEARLLGTSCLTPSNELPDWGVLLPVSHASPSCRI